MATTTTVQVLLRPDAAQVYTVSALQDQLRMQEPLSNFIVDFPSTENKRATNKTLYDKDFFEWTQTTAALLRADRWQEIDIESLAEEIESLGKRDRRELGSRLQVLVMHLLKWAYQPTHRSSSWRTTIRTQRAEIQDVLDDSPSLEGQVQPLLDKRYSRARADAIDETGLPDETFPEECPWTAEEVKDHNFWPEGQ